MHLVALLNVLTSLFPGFLLGDQLADSWLGLCKPDEALQPGGVVTRLLLYLQETPLLLGPSSLSLRLQTLLLVVKNSVNRLVIAAQHVEQGMIYILMKQIFFSNKLVS